MFLFLKELYNVLLELQYLGWWIYSYTVNSTIVFDLVSISLQYFVIVPLSGLLLSLIMMSTDHSEDTNEYSSSETGYRSPD